VEGGGEGGRERGRERGGEGGTACVRADAFWRPRGRIFASARTCHVRADELLRPRGRALSARTLGCVRTEKSVLFPCNFITDATVRPSHDWPSGHRLIVRPSVIVRVTTLPDRAQFGELVDSREQGGARVRETRSPGCGLVDKFFIYLFKFFLILFLIYLFILYLFFVTRSGALKTEN
jgi:hypothetical protein